MKAITKDYLIKKISLLLNKRLRYNESSDRYYYMKVDTDGFVDKGDVSVHIDTSICGHVECMIEIIFNNLDRWFIIHLFDDGTISMQENKDNGDIIDFFTDSTNLNNIAKFLPITNDIINN